MVSKNNDFGLNSFLSSWQNMVQNLGVKPNVQSFVGSDQFAKIRSGFFEAMQKIEPDLPQMQEVRDFQIENDGIVNLARAYTPHSAHHPVGPAIVFYHGGGFVMGDCDSYDSICRRLADASGCRVLSVEYRLAPEHKFPSQIDDSIFAFNWAHENAEKWGADKSKIAVGGDSAGGNLAINITRAALAGECPEPVFQLLIYPLTQFVDLKEKGVSFQEGSFFSPSIFDFCRSAYLEEGQSSRDLRVSPLFHDKFQGLPPAHVVTAGWDPLRDEGKAYFDKLCAAGVRATHQDYPSHPHGFYNSTGVSKSAREAIAVAGQILSQALASK